MSSKPSNAFQSETTDERTIRLLHDEITASMDRRGVPTIAKSIWRLHCSLPKPDCWTAG